MNTQIASVQFTVVALPFWSTSKATVTASSAKTRARRLVAFLQMLQWEVCDLCNWLIGIPPPATQARGPNNRLGDRWKLGRCRRFMACYVDYVVSWCSLLLPLILWSLFGQHVPPVSWGMRTCEQKHCATPWHQTGSQSSTFPCSLPLIFLGLGYPLLSKRTNITNITIMEHQYISWANQL